MWDFDWSGLNPPQKVLFMLLIVTAICSITAVVLLLAKIVVELATKREVAGLVKLVHEMFRASALVRQEITRKTDKVERVSEGTALAAQKAVEVAEKTSRHLARATEEVKQEVRQIVEKTSNTPPTGSDAPNPRATPRSE